MFQLQYSIANAQIQMWWCLCKFSKCYLFHSNMLILLTKGQGKWLDCSLRSFFLHPSSWPRCHLPVLLNPSPYLHSAAFPHHPLTAFLAPSERVPSPTVSPWLHPWGRTPPWYPLFILSLHTFPFACCLPQPLPQQDLSFKDLYLSPFLCHFSTSNQVKLLWCFRACMSSCSQRSHWLNTIRWVSVCATHTGYLDIIPYFFLRSTLRAKDCMKTVTAEQQIHSDRKVQSTWWVRPTNLQAVVVCTKTGSGTLFKDKVKRILEPMLDL